MTLQKLYSVRFAEFLPCPSSAEFLRVKGNVDQVISRRTELRVPKKCSEKDDGLVCRRIALGWVNKSRAVDQSVDTLRARWSNTSGRRVWEVGKGTGDAETLSVVFVLPKGWSEGTAAVLTQIP